MIWMAMPTSTRVGIISVMLIRGRRFGSWRILSVLEYSSLGLLGMEAKALEGIC